MSDPINITAIYDINTGRDRIEITDDIAAEIVRRGSQTAVAAGDDPISDLRSKLQESEHLLAVSRSVSAAAARDRDRFLMHVAELRNDADVLRGTVNATVAERDALQRECVAMKEQNVRLNAQVDVLLSKDGRNYCMKVEAERDAALSEVAALKTRKVTGETK